MKFNLILFYFNPISSNFYFVLFYFKVNSFSISFYFDFIYFNQPFHFILIQSQLFFCKSILFYFDLLRIISIQFYFNLNSFILTQILLIPIRFHFDFISIHLFHLFFIPLKSPNYPQQTPQRKRILNRSSAALTIASIPTTQARIRFQNIPSDGLRWRRPTAKKTYRKRPLFE